MERGGRKERDRQTDRVIMTERDFFKMASWGCSSLQVQDTFRRGALGTGSRPNPVFTLCPAEAEEKVLAGECWWF